MTKYQNNHREGIQNEKLAINYLKSKRYKIIKLHHRDSLNKSDIDILAKHRNTIVFVEVKSRRNTKLAYFPKKKKNVVKELINKYKKDHPNSNSFRADIVFIKYDRARRKSIKHVKNVIKL